MLRDRSLRHRQVVHERPDRLLTADQCIQDVATAPFNNGVERNSPRSAARTPPAGASGTPAPAEPWAALHGSGSRAIARHLEPSEYGGVSTSAACSMSSSSRQVVEHRQNPLGLEGPCQRNGQPGAVTLHAIGGIWAGCCGTCNDFGGIFGGAMFSTYRHRGHRSLERSLSRRIDTPAAARRLTRVMLVATSQTGARDE